MWLVTCHEEWSINTYWRLLCLINTETGVVSQSEGRRYFWICNEFHNLRIYFYDDKHLQFFSCTKENPWSHSQWEMLHYIAKIIVTLALSAQTEPSTAPYLLQSWYGIPPKICMHVAGCWETPTWICKHPTYFISDVVTCSLSFFHFFHEQCSCGRALIVKVATCANSTRVTIM